MFSGIGGFEYGIQRAFDKQFAQIKQDRQGRNRNIDQVEHNVLLASRTTALCVGYSEIDKYAIKVYERNFNGDNRPNLRNRAKNLQENITNTTKRKNRITREHKNYGNATTINATELPDFDLLVGGFPCQAFSIAGKRAGFDDTRGTLFFDIARILKEKQPRNLVLENVKGLLSHDSGRTFTTIIGVLADLGYFVEWQVLNSKDFGVPQNRERVFIVGHLGRQPRQKVFPIIGSYAEPAAKNEKEYLIQDKRQSAEFRKYLDYSPVVSSYWGMGGGNVPIVMPKIRRLTPLECERLQGFPDDWTKYGIGDEPISDTQRYKMCGNAVTTNVVEAVMTNLRRVM